MRPPSALGPAFLAAVLILAPACGGSGEPDLPLPSDPDVELELNEWNILPEPDTVEAGRVVFLARNTGRSLHDLIVLRTRRSPDDLPVRGGRADLDSPAVDEMGRIEPFRPGESHALALRMEAGSYVLICNVGGHYAAGMHAAFTVR